MKIVSGELTIGFCAGVIAAMIIYAMSPSAGKAELKGAPQMEVADRDTKDCHGLNYVIDTINGHDYLFVRNNYRSCCVIHAESCPCKSGAHTN